MPFYRGWSLLNEVLLVFSAVQPAWHGPYSVLRQRTWWRWFCRNFWRSHHDFRLPIRKAFPEQDRSQRDSDTHFKAGKQAELLLLGNREWKHPRCQKELQEFQSLGKWSKGIPNWSENWQLSCSYTITQQLLFFTMGNSGKKLGLYYISYILYMRIHQKLPIVFHEKATE